MSSSKHNARMRDAAIAAATSLLSSGNGVAHAEDMLEVAGAVFGMAMGCCERPITPEEVPEAVRKVVTFAFMGCLTNGVFLGEQEFVVSMKNVEPPLGTSGDPDVTLN